MRYIAILSLASAVSLSAATPVWEWNFERKVQKDYFESDKAAGKISKLWMKGKGRGKAGVRHSNALDCGKESYNYIQKFRDLLKWKAFTVDMQFKLDAPVNEKNGNTLMWYSAHSWGRSDFLLKITPKKEIMAQFFTKDSNSGKIKLSYTVTSPVQEIEPGKFYSLRVSSVSGGNLKIYLDGVMIAARDKSFSFKDLTPGKEEYYPLLIVGGESRMGKPRYQLGGVVDDFKLYNQEVEMSDFTPAVSSGSVQNGRSANMPLSLGTPSETARFTVLDIDMQAGVVFKKADKIFQQNAAKAVICVKNNKVVVEFICPVSPAHPVASAEEAGYFWGGELVEFFWQTAPEKGYFQYAYNVSRKEQNAIAYNAAGARIDGFASDWQAEYSSFSGGYRVKMSIPCKELGIDPSDKENIYRANFTRTGKSAGGKSTWAKVGHNFHNLAGFGEVAGGDLKDYFAVKFAALKKKTASVKLNKNMQDKLETIAANIKKYGNDPRQFTSLNRQFTNFENDLVMHILAGKKLIISQPDMWSNDLTPGLMTRPVEKFTVRMEQNTVTFLPFAVSNMTDKRFLCRIKCMDDIPHNAFDSYPKKPFPLNAGFREAIAHDDNSGQSLFDALVELPMGQLLRIAPQDTAAVWLKLDSHNIAPGTYKTCVIFKSATEGVDNEIIPLEVEVVPVDLGKIKTDVALYNYIQARFVNTFDAPKDELLRYLTERDVNYLFCNVPGDKDMDIYPPLDADGNPGECDFTHLDRNIDSYVKAGMDIKQMKLWFYLAMDYSGYVLTSKGKHCTLKEFSPQWENALKSFYTQLFSHLEKKYGITADRVVFCVVDEPHGNFNDPASSVRKAWEYAKVIKRIAPQAVLYANPYALKDDANTRQNFSKLAEYMDILAPYSGQLTQGLVDHINTLGFKEVWTYNILQKHHGPEHYRRKIWENLNYGFSPVSPYWHTDQADGGDGFCAFDVSTAYGVRRNDYATIFSDFASGKGVVSRRQEAFYLGCQDAKLILLCRRLTEGKAEAALVKDLVAKGAAGDMRTITECREKLLEIALKYLQ